MGFILWGAHDILSKKTLEYLPLCLDKKKGDQRCGIEPRLQELPGTGTKHYNVKITRSTRKGW